MRGEQYSKIDEKRASAHKRIKAIARDFPLSRPPSVIICIDCLSLLFSFFVVDSFSSLFSFLCSLSFCLVFLPLCVRCCPKDDGAILLCVCVCDYEDSFIRMKASVDTSIYVYS